MISKYEYSVSFNYLLKKFVQQHLKKSKLKNYPLDIEDYNFFTFYNILKNDFDINVMVVKLDDLEYIEGLSFPSIAYLKINGGLFVLINDYKDQKVYWESKEYGKQICKVNLFKKISESVFLVSY